MNGDCKKFERCAHLWARGEGGEKNKNKNTSTRVHASDFFSFPLLFFLFIIHSLSSSLSLSLSLSAHTHTQKKKQKRKEKNKKWPVPSSLILLHRFLPSAPQILALHRLNFFFLPFFFFFFKKKTLFQFLSPSFFLSSCRFPLLAATLYNFLIRLPFFLFFLFKKKNKKNLLTNSINVLLSFIFYFMPFFSFSFIHSFIHLLPPLRDSYDSGRAVITARANMEPAKRPSKRAKFPQMAARERWPAVVKEPVRGA